MLDGGRVSGVERGSTTAVVGSSGCGKTTLLRLIAGFEAPTPARSPIAGRRSRGPAGSVPAHRRSVGYVAQDGALFPHLTVATNIAFGLRGARAARARSCARVAELLEMVSLDGSYALASAASSCPAGSSSGSRWRARSPASPVLMLLDEPFSALDAGLRAVDPQGGREALVRAGVTTLLVTHDQEEALSFADQVAVMRDGRFTQVGTPQQVYREPTDRFTAEFLGDCVCSAVHRRIRGGRLRARAHPRARSRSTTAPLHLCCGPNSSSRR